MIRIIGITVGLVILTVGGGIGLSNAHGSAGKAAISSPEPFAPDNAELGRLAWPVQSELTTDAPTVAEMSNVVSKDVLRANVLRWRLFGSTLAPESGQRPKSRGHTQTHTAHASGDLVFDAPVIAPAMKPAAPSIPRNHTFATPRAIKTPPTQRRSMNASPKPGFLIGVFR
ncbi:MAG: hypothetical protein WA782_09960 [Sulfitobacter sp.]